MRKIPRCLENPLDNIIIDACESFAQFYRKLGYTPNDITTLSLIFGILSILLLYKGYAVPAVICYGISYMYDCCDGYFARKYDMCTKFGDLYDHIKDWTVNIGYFVVLYQKYKHKLSTKQWLLAVAFLVLLLFIQLIYFGAQERYYDKLDAIPSLGWVVKLIPTKKAAIKTLKWARYFGCGTFISYIMLFTLFVVYKK
jgi:phosphatidylglycerophosphate synthase